MGYNQTSDKCGIEEDYSSCVFKTVNMYTCIFLYSNFLIQCIEINIFFFCIS